MIAASERHIIFAPRFSCASQRSRACFFCCPSRYSGNQKVILSRFDSARGVGEKLLEAWKPYEGQIYSQQLLENYIHENAAHLSWKARPWPLTPADGQDHIVNFVLDFDDSGDTN